MHSPCQYNSVHIHKLHLEWILSFAITFDVATPPVVSTTFTAWKSARTNAIAQNFARTCWKNTTILVNELQRICWSLIYKNDWKIKNTSTISLTTQKRSACEVNESYACACDCHVTCSGGRSLRKWLSSHRVRLEVALPFELEYWLASGETLLFLHTPEKKKQETTV